MSMPWDSLESCPLVTYISTWLASDHEVLVQNPDSPTAAQTQTGCAEHLITEMPRSDKGNQRQR